MKRNTLKSFAGTAAVALTLSLFGAGCESEPDTLGEHIEEAGDEIGDAVDDAKDAVEDAADEVEDATDG